MLSLKGHTEMYGKASIQCHLQRQNMEERTKLLLQIHFGLIQIWLICVVVELNSCDHRLRDFHLIDH